jgi:hypothetical protein
MSVMSVMECQCMWIWSGRWVDGSLDGVVCVNLIFNFNCIVLHLAKFIQIYHFAPVF